MRIPGLNSSPHHQQQQPIGYMFKRTKNESFGININGKKVSHLRFANDLVLITGKFDKVLFIYLSYAL